MKKDPTLLIPFFSAILIFIGYLNHHFFYTHFDIPISTYLSTSEVVFSFLPLTVPFLLTICFFILVSLGLHVVIVRQEKKEIEYSSEYESDSFLSIPKAWKNVKIKWNNSKNLFDWAILFLIYIGELIFSIAIQLFLIGYVYALVNSLISNDPYFSATTIIIFGVLWLLIILMRKAIYKKEETKKRITGFLFMLSISVGIFLLWVKNKEDATEILNGHPEFIVTLNLEKSTVESDSSLVYVGKTSEFIFMRNLKKKQNIIYKMSDVKTFRQLKTKANSQ